MPSKYKGKYNKYKTKYLILKKRVMIDTRAGRVLKRQTAGVDLTENIDKLRNLLGEKDISINFDHNDVIILQILNDKNDNHYALVTNDGSFDDKLEYFKSADFDIIKAKTDDGIVIAYCKFETNPDNIEDIIKVFVEYIGKFYDTSFEFLQLYSFSLNGIDLNAVIDLEKSNLS